jgi:scyllo-inositol 2-dehydrogenase (NADP+)
MPDLRIGLIGYGYAGQTFHAPLIVGSGRAALAAIATGQPERARADWPNARIHPTPEALIADAGVECVVIATPNDTHVPLARAALEAGKHVVVDKPVALKSADIRDLAVLATKRGLVLAPFHNRRWDGDFLTVRALLDSGRLGRLTVFESHFDRFRPLVRQRWREDAQRGGGLLFDLGPHLVDQALALFGKPQTISATVTARRDGAQADDFVHMLLGYADKEVILHASALTAIVAPRFTLHGTRGSYIKYGLDTQEDQLKAGLRPGDAQWGHNPAGELRLLDGDTQITLEQPTADGAYQQFYAGVADAIQHGSPLPVSAQDAADGLAIIELARESAASGRRLEIA